MESCPVLFFFSFFFFGGRVCVGEAKGRKGKGAALAFVLLCCIVYVSRALSVGWMDGVLHIPGDC